GVLDVSNITSGGVSQTTGGTITATTLQSTKSIAGGLILTSVNNAVGTLGAVTASSGDIAVVSNPGTGLKIANTVSATSGNLYVANSDTAGIVFTASGAASASGIVGLQADKLTLPAGATISAATAEIAPSTSGRTVTLGATGGLSLANVTGITANTLRVGAITLPGSASPAIEAGSIAVAGAFDTKTIGALDLQATGAVTQAAALTTGTLLATAGTITLTNAANSIGAFGSLTATSGNIAIKDATAVTILGAVHAVEGNVYLESANAGGITFGTAGSISSVAGGTIGLQTDKLVNLGTSGATGILNAGSAGLFELAPDTVGHTVNLGTASGLSLTDLTGITAGTVRIGGVTQPGSGAPTTRAGSIAIGGAFDLGGSNLDVEASGAVTQAAALTGVGTLTGTVSAVTLTNTGNAIETLGPLTASAGTLAVVDSSALTVAGTVQAPSGNIYLADSNADGITLAAGAALISQTGGVIGLRTDA